MAAKGGKKNLVELSSQIQHSAASRLDIASGTDFRDGRKVLSSLESPGFSGTRTPSPTVHQKLERDANRMRRAPRELPPLAPQNSSTAGMAYGAFNDMQPEYGPSLGTHKPVVPTPHDEANTLVTKLNTDHSLASRMAVGGTEEEAGTATTTPREGGAGAGGLFEVGLDERSLVSAGLSSGAIDRLYRGLHNYTFAFRELIDREIAQASDGHGTLKQTMVKEFGLLLSMIKTDLLSDDTREESLARHDETRESTAEAQAGPPAGPLDAELEGAAGLGADGIDIILRAKGTFELRNQALQRLLLEERQTTSKLSEEIWGLEDEKQKMQLMAKDMKERTDEMQRVHEERKAEARKKQEWFDKTLQENSQKLTQSHDTIRNLQAKMKEEERKTAMILNEKQELYISLQDATHSRDEMKSTMSVLKEKVAQSDNALKAQYEKFKDDIEKSDELKASLDTCIEERNVARELYDEEAAEVLKLKEEIEERESEKSKLNARILALQKTLKDKGSELESERSLSEGLKEEIKRLSQCESDLADTKMNLSYALDITEMKQREGEKQRLYTEDLLATAKNYLEEARTKHVELEKLNKKLEKLLREKHEVVTNLKEKGKILEDRAVASEEQASSLHKQYEVALDGRARAEAAAEELERNLKETTKKNWKLEEKLEEYRTDLRDTKRQNTKFEAHAQMLNQKLKETQERETKKENKFKDEIKRHVSQIKQLKARVEEMTPKVQMVDKMKQSLEELQGKHSALLVDCDTWHKKYESADKEKQAFKQKFDTASTTIGDLTTKLNSSDKMVKLLKTNKAENEERIRNLVQEVNTLTGERDQLMEELKETRELRSTAETNLDYEKEDNILKEEQLAETLDKLDALQEKFKKIETKKRGMTTKIRTLRSSNEEIRSKFENTIDRFHEERRAWLEAVNVVRQEFSKMWNDIRDDLSARSEVVAVAGQVNENLANTSRLLSATDAFSTYEVISNFKEMIKEETAQVKVVTKKKQQETKSAATMLKMRRAMEHERKKRMKEEQQKQIELLKKQYETQSVSSSAANSAVVKEQLMKREKQFMEEMSTLQERLDKAIMDNDMEREKTKSKEEEVKALEIVKERILYQNDELSTTLQRKIRENSEMLDEANTRVQHLTLQLSNANRSRIWKEKYATQLNEQLKRARYELMQLGRQPTLVAKCIQTQYCDLWALNVLKEEERNDDTRQTWTRQLTITPQVEIMSMQKVIDLISQIFSDKLLADLAAVRAGKLESVMIEFVYDFFFDKYGLEDLTMKYLTQLGASLLHHQGNPTVRVFASLCDLLPKDNTTSSKELGFQKDMGTVMETQYLYGINWDKTLLAFNNRLAFQVSKVVPNNIYSTQEPLIHSMTHGFNFEVTQMPFMREILHICRSDNLFDDLSGFDIGILLSEQQLPQLYRLLVEACDILKVDVPGIYINGGPMWDTCLVCPGNDKPFMILTTSVIEVLKPMELQVVMAQQLLPLVDKSYAPLMNACSLASVASDLFLTRDIARSQWQSAVLPTVVRLQQALDLTADRLALLVAQDFDLVVGTIMKLNVSSDALGNQMNPQMLLEQAEAVGSAASKYLNRYDEKEKNLAVQGGTRKLYSARQDLDQSSDLKNVAHASLSMSLVSCSNSLSMLRARELQRWRDGPDYKSLMEESKAYNIF